MLILGTTSFARFLKKIFNNSYVVILLPPDDQKNVIEATFLHKIFNIVRVINYILYP